MDLFGAIAKRDGQLAGRLMLERSRSSNCVDPDVFVSSIANLVDKALATGLKLGNMEVGTLLANVCTVSCTQRVRLESNFVNVVLAIMVSSRVPYAWCSIFHTKYFVTC